jgi:hypothetical protein
MVLSRANERETWHGNWAKRLAPSLGGVIGSTLFFVILINGDALLRDADTGWHIRTGDYILENLTVPKTDFFSHRKFGEPWISHEWLSQTIFAAVHTMASLNGVVVLSAGIISLTFILLFRLLQAYRFNLFTVTGVTMLAALTSSIHWLARPHLFSLCIGLVWFSVLEKFQANPSKKILWTLPILMVVWVNLHGGFVFGFVLLAIYGIVNFLCLIAVRTTERQPHKSRVVLLLKTGFLCLLASFVNPYGFELLAFPFEQFASTESLSSIGEWKSPNFHEFTFYEFYLLLLLAVTLIARREVRLVHLFLAIFVIHASLVSQRFIPYFAVFLTPILGQQIDALYNELISQPGRVQLGNLVRLRIRKSLKNLQHFNGRLHDFALVVFLCSTMFIVACNDGTIFGRKILDFHFQAPRFPVAAVQFLERNPLPGLMFNFYSYGGYLIYKFYPDSRYLVFVDGRSIVNGDDYFTEYQKVNLTTQHWREILKVYRVNWVIYPAGSWLCTLMLEDSDWKLIYSDETANIFLKNIESNRSMIGKFRDAEPHR